MDLGFSTRTTGVPRAGATPARVDHRMLLAAIAAMQGADPAAIAARLRAAPAPGGAREALIAVLCHESAWAGAAIALGGSFDPRAAAAIAGKTRSTLMKARFTFAF